MPQLNRDDVAIGYDWYPADVDNAPTVLLSHGYSATAVMWQGQLEALRPHCNVLTWDMRGHGASDSPTDPALYSEALTVGDMLALLDACDVEQACIAGLSLGGYMSLAFHRRYPERCAALMLFDTGPGYKNDAARAGWNRMAQERAEAFERDGLAALGPGAEVAASTHRSAAGLAHAARGLLCQVDDRVIQSLPDIAVPTLVLVGALDEAFLTPSAYMAGKIPGARHVVIPEAGHAANIDQPEAFNRAVIEFLTSVL